MFSTLSFAILYSTIVLYATQKLHLSEIVATSIMGSFCAFNYGLHLLGGYLGGRFISWRFLFVIGMLLQVVSCLLLSIANLDFFYYGLALFLAGSGLNVTCINMMVTQLFEPHDKRRESAFLWNYALMNVGFFIGFSVAGYFQIIQNFSLLFILASIGNALTAIITLFAWKNLKDQNTILTSLTKKQCAKRFSYGIYYVIFLSIAMVWFIRHSEISNLLVLFVGVAMFFTIAAIAYFEKNKDARNKLFAYIIFALASLIFWTLYQLAPMALTLFAEYNVNRNYGGFLIAPQWIQNINSFVLAFGGPILGFVIQKLRKSGIQLSLSLQFSLSLLCVGTGLAILPIGIAFAAGNGLVSFSWIFWSYILQSIGELFIGPIGYAMIGQLIISRKLQGIMMGVWMMTSGVGAILSNYASTYAIRSSTATNPLMTNPGYSHMFSLLGITTIAAGIILFALIPLLKKLTHE
jgi:POT family proton-dependent oligopeptide transporter